MNDISSGLQEETTAVRAPDGGSEFLKQFEEIWNGGYFEGNPKEPLGGSSYGLYGYTSALFTTYMACLRPYVGAASTVLEIGPGRGAWSKAILGLNPRRLYVVDAASAEHTRFWDYVGPAQNVTYLQVRDFSLNGIPNGGIDHFFSFGVFCHLRSEMCEAYVNALAAKMKPSANGFLQFADFDKYNACVRQPERTSLLRPFLSLMYQERDRAGFFARAAQRMAVQFLVRGASCKPLSKTAALNIADSDGRGSWHHWGTDAACAALEASGFKVIERDVGILNRDPITHFVRK